MRDAAMHDWPATSQRGLSLIELMVAMVIGSFLILGVTQIFISNQKSYLFQQGQAGNQENGRFTLAVLNQELTKAGYRSDPTTVFPAGAGQSCTFPTGTSVIAVSSTALCIRYQARNRSDVTCQGMALSDTAKATITTPYDHSKTNPVIIEKIAYDPDSQSITCTSGTTTQALVTGVAGLRFEYGAGSGDLKAVSTYSTSVTSSSPNMVIGAVRFAILMQSPTTASIRDTTTKSLALDEWNTRYSASVADSKQIYQLVQGTVMIRNQMQ
jgi:type IV pilus assembly protein PilW